MEEIVYSGYEEVVYSLCIKYSLCSCESKLLV